MHKIFVGADGLRAGWSLLLFAVLFVVFELLGNLAVSALLHTSLSTAPPNGGISLSTAFSRDLLSALATLLATWIMSTVECRHFAVYGFAGARKLLVFVGGLLWGVLCLSLLIFSLWKSAFLVIDRRLLFGADSFRYGALWLIAFLCVAVFEESLTRGYMMFTFTRGFTGLYRSLFKTGHSHTLGFWTAAMLLSILFGLGHGRNPGESPIGLLSAGLAGLVFCLSLWRTGSLWWAIGFHATWDWAQSFLYGTADSGAMVQNHLLATHPVGPPILSGGATGPEGSALILPVFLLIAVIILFTLPNTRNSMG